MGATITIDADDRQVFDMFSRLRVLGGDLSEPLRQIGEYELDATRERANREVGPDGVPWVPLSDRYERIKARKRPGRTLLRFDNMMLGPQLSFGSDATQMVLGTNAPQGAVMHFGRADKNIPARQWIGFSNEDVAAFLVIISEAVKRTARS